MIKNSLNDFSELLNQLQNPCTGHRYQFKVLIGSKTLESCSNLTQILNQCPYCPSWLHMSSINRIPEENRKEIGQNRSNTQSVLTGAIHGSTTTSDDRRGLIIPSLDSWHQGDHSRISGRSCHGRSRPNSMMLEGTLTLIGFARFLMNPFDRITHVQIKSNGL